MKNYTMENEKMSVTIADKGAELIHIFEKEHQREIIWQADPKFWARHAPVLFPNVGQHYGKHFLYQGQYYPAGQHGFARDMEFTRIAQGEDFVTHRLRADEETKKKYPFGFCLEITHRLEQGKLTIQWKVINEGDDAMYFTIGGHPAFQVPVLPDTKLSDYFLQFEKEKDSLTYLLLDTDTGTANGKETFPLPLTDHKYQMKEDMFDKDALIFDEAQIEWVAITLPDGTPYVAVEAKDFPNFGIWSKPGAPYVCLEPWCGRCDNSGFTGEISEKKGINTLQAGETFEKAYQIIVY